MSLVGGIAASGVNWSGIGNAAGSILSPVISFLGGNAARNSASDDMRYAADKAYQTARENRNWMEYMSNSAHQREVKDLIAADLNPVLSAMGGIGASSPNADTSVSGNYAPLNANPTDAFIGVSNALNALTQSRAQIANINTDTALKQSGVSETYQNIQNKIQELEESKSRQNVNRAEIGRINKQIDFYQSQIKNLDVQNKLYGTQMQLNQATAKYQLRRSSGKLSGQNRSDGYDIKIPGFSYGRTQSTGYNTSL